MISIDRRLKVCAQMVKGSGIVCDIGTDHAYLPVYLIENNVCKRVIAADVNDGPLMAAKQTVQRSGTVDSISIVKSDGLNGIDLEGVSDVIIAGLGGETIADIISDSRCRKNGINFVFQPMSKAGFLRRSLYKNGFEIISEKAVCEDRYIYTAINAVYTGVSIELSRTAEVIGKVDPQSEDGRIYCADQYNKMMNISVGLAKAGKTADSMRYEKIAHRLELILKGKMDMVSEIYKFIDSAAPFSTQEKWDNSGLITGSMNRKVSRVLVCLDITNEVADEAVDLGAELVISHHPVIFHPLYHLDDDEPACKLWKNGISAICVHTPFDAAKNGMSDILLELAGFKKTDGLLEVMGGGDEPYGFGSIGISDTEYSSKELAMKLRDLLHCTVVKYTEGSGMIKKAAFCTGSGGNLIEAAVNSGADAYITSEIKHDQWLYARRKGISVFDCGHYHTEIVGMERLCKLLSAEFSNIEFLMSKVDKDPVSYVF